MKYSNKQKKRYYKQYIIWDIYSNSAGTRKMYELVMQLSGRYSNLKLGIEARTKTARNKKRKKPIETVRAKNLEWLCWVAQLKIQPYKSADVGR